jgi:hypothetical protein
MKVRRLLSTVVASLENLENQIVSEKYLLSTIWKVVRASYSASVLLMKSTRLQPRARLEETQREIRQVMTEAMRNEMKQMTLIVQLLVEAMESESESEANCQESAGTAVLDELFEMKELRWKKQPEWTFVWI